MVQKGPFFVGDENPLPTKELVDALSKEYVLLKLMPSLQAKRPTLNDTENVDDSMYVTGFRAGHNHCTVNCATIFHVVCFCLLLQSPLHDKSQFRLRFASPSVDYMFLEIPPSLLLFQ